MELIRGIQNIRARHHGCVLTIGNFDGVHRGHQALLKHLKQEASQRGLPTVVMTFEPQPLEFFLPEKAPARLTRLRDKIKYLAECGIDYLLCVKFDKQFAAQTPEEFVSSLLVNKLGVKFLAIGDDFRFGKNREGDFHFLQQAGARYGFEVANTESYCDKGLRISSTAVREALLNDDLVLAESLLGHPYSICGRVIHGNELGRTIGFPTANIPMKRLVAPVKGVYAVDVYLSDNQSPLPGVANIGSRPTVKGKGVQLEVHLIDVNMDLYGRRIDVVLRKKLRNEQRFASLDALKQQIADDVATARDFLSQRSES
ncbi:MULTISPECIES: bifunctional riboflavin kinase/FAD synthetase [Enterobacterales]|uniref:bifunctional riboflavin kinase/FAD synthetase n=1 Tax=Enterobacterales TaxID=91347 RepID=UPI0008481FF4|nr:MULTISPECIES: bifunctional riboflavin kinase/FAD synthetase [Enterobacterales]WOO50434.1 bifunctional riboflavin kinase/FAD synthetase [Hafnia alvei]MCK9782542.1 bifunctional riboflavin kinase/FAD synthetase [Proteus columbae]MCT6517801.1 bifunctional riboflavin kinase/FAD synthetase [Proteus vulgaris]ODQ06214.1 riboflavin biosynthesis protein RibF [Shigella sp. FC130]OEI93726.1 riboflavin biosynthesis protein RibF [Shigella sp. FC1655]